MTRVHRASPVYITPHQDSSLEQGFTGQALVIEKGPGPRHVEAEEG